MLQVECLAQGLALSQHSHEGGPKSYYILTGTHKRTSSHSHACSLPHHSQALRSYQAHRYVDSALNTTTVGYTHANM